MEERRGDTPAVSECKCGILSIRTQIISVHSIFIQPSDQLKRTVHFRLLNHIIHKVHVIRKVRILLIRYHIGIIELIFDGGGASNIGRRRAYTAYIYVNSHGGTFGRAGRTGCECHFCRPLASTVDSENKHGILSIGLERSIIKIRISVQSMPACTYLRGCLPVHAALLRHIDKHCSHLVRRVGVKYST